jgi:hypothetical protein
VVKLYLVKYEKETTLKKIGAAIAWMISAFLSDVRAKPMFMVAAHSIHPINQWINRIKLFFVKNLVRLDFRAEVFVLSI